MSDDTALVIGVSRSSMRKLEARAQAESTLRGRFISPGTMATDLLDAALFGVHCGYCGHEDTDGCSCSCHDTST